MVKKTDTSKISSAMQEFWKQRRVFVTGGTGFIGSWLVKKLLQMKAQVFVLIHDSSDESELFLSGSHKRVHFIQGELENFRLLDQTLKDCNIETVFHLGAQTQVGHALLKPLDTFESNIRGTYNLLEACRLNQAKVKRVVVASSDKAYGMSSTLPYDEEKPLQGCFPYDVSKTCTDLLANTYFQTYQMPIGIARCGNVFGGGDFNWDRLIPGTIQKFYQNERPQLRSDGLCLRDYLYVEDVVEAYLLLAQALEQTNIHGQAFNFSMETPLSVLSVVGSLKILMNKKDLPPHIYAQAEAEIQDQYLSCNKAKQMLNWKPKHSFEEALMKTVGWYQSYFLEKQVARITEPSLLGKH